MRRYWVPEKYCDANHVFLKGDIFHHICVVCRQSLNDRFEVIFAGQAHLVEIASMEKKQAVAKIISSRALPPQPQPHIHLALSFSKISTIEKVLEKMVELGVTTVHLFHSDFSFKKPRPEELVKKIPRWHKIIQGAIQQTGRGDLMELTQIRPLSVLLSESLPKPGRVGLLAYEGEAAMTLKERVSQLPQELAEIWLFVGSEGGFSPQDLELFKDYNILPLSLGEQVLRVETACVSLVSILKYGIGHFD